MDSIWTCEHERNGIPCGENSMTDNMERDKYAVYTESKDNSTQLG